MNVTVRKIGNSEGVILPKEVLERMNVKAGDELEVIENKDNFNYSRGLLFVLDIPYYHTGLRVGYAVNDQVTGTGYLLNGWNNVIENNWAGDQAGYAIVLTPRNYNGVAPWSAVRDVTITNNIIESGDALGGAGAVCDRSDRVSPTAAQ